MQASSSTREISATQPPLQQAFKEVDAVIHLAAQIDVTASVTNPTETHEINTTRTFNVLQAATENHVKKFVFASSTAVYGDAKNLPIKEDTPLKPISPYAASKAAGEAYCSAYANCYNLSTLALRFFNVYATGNENSPYSGVITKLLQKACNDEGLTVDGDGEQTRDFIHVNDVVSAIILALESNGLNGEVFNVCTGNPTSINQLVAALRKVTGKDLRVKHGSARVGDIRSSYGDPAKSAEKLGFKSSDSLLQGLKMLLNECGA
jgi:UDP-glucose 4-epimerase